jgi:hypothetical protein
VISLFFLYFIGWICEHLRLHRVAFRSSICYGKWIRLRRREVMEFDRHCRLMILLLLYSSQNLFLLIHVATLTLVSLLRLFFMLNQR